MNSAWGTWGGKGATPGGLTPGGTMPTIAELNRAGGVPAPPPPPDLGSNAGSESAADAVGEAGIVSSYVAESYVDGGNTAFWNTDPPAPMVMAAPRRRRQPMMPTNLVPGLLILAAGLGVGWFIFKKGTP